MRKTYYGAASLGELLRWFESEYGLGSEEFYEAQLAGERPEGMPTFHRHAWASFYRDYRRLSGESFASRAERVLIGSR